MPHFSANGAEFQYETAGSGEPLILIHGSIMGGAFAPLLREPALTDRFAVTHYVRRGFTGSSKHEGPFSIAQQAADARAVIEHVAGGRAHVAGHSYGGVTALVLALDAPQAVQTLSLLEPPLPVPSAEAFFAALPPIAGMYEAGDRAGALDAFATLVIGPDFRPACDAALGSGWYERALADLDCFFQVEVPALNDVHLTEGDARRIAQPVLSVVGANSDQFFKEGDELIRQWFPQAESYTLAGATHGLQVQNPGDLAEAMAAFLAKYPIPTPAPA